jgi:hypothetical protein
MDENFYNPLLSGHKFIIVLFVDDGCTQEKIRGNGYESEETRGEPIRSLKTFEEKFMTLGSTWPSCGWPPKSKHWPLVDV